MWQGLISHVDWSARTDQIENLALREVSVRMLVIPESIWGVLIKTFSEIRADS